MKFTPFIALSVVGLTAALPAPDTDHAGRDIVVSTIAHSEIPVPKFAVPPGATIVTPNAPFRALNPSLVDSVVTCPARNCAGTCYSFALSSLTTGVCYTPTSAFFSAELYIGSGVIPSYSAYVSTTFTKCGNAYKLPINACGSPPADGFDFFLQ
ncbi:hypothetical protein CPB83DRAFT_845390 [Crepidotus variabilis]|uniref:Uncharacterized protein n=1 Tax=Crepidotus variabilis TaxID=179855 RepID=A0A9P6JV23_9AGAR|nr:hypothetical protein CPB83DRAFT_845390 [Crepidotus variabilis]